MSVPCSELTSEERHERKRRQSRDWWYAHPEYKKTPEFKAKVKAANQRFGATVHGRAKSLLRGAEIRSIMRGLPFELTLKWIEKHLNPLRCELSGEKFVLEAGHPLIPTIDRIIPKYGYVPRNCRIITKKLNNMLSSYGHDEFLRLAKLIAKNVK